MLDKAFSFVYLMLHLKLSPHPARLLLELAQEIRWRLYSIAPSATVGPLCLSGGRRSPKKCEGNRETRKEGARNQWNKYGCRLAQFYLPLNESALIWLWSQFAAVYGSPSLLNEDWRGRFSSGFSSSQALAFHLLSHFFSVSRYQPGINPSKFSMSSVLHV